MVGGVGLVFCAWLFTQGEDEDNEKHGRVRNMLAWMGAIVVIVVLVLLANKYVWPGAHNPDDDYR